MTKRILLCLIACAISLTAFAQSLAEITSPNLLPPPPEAAALGKYGQIPVDKSSGIPTISIPLYEIKTPRFTVPISLSYHASGIKVDETSTWVGAGWSLNAGGVITRTVVNIPDENAGGFLYSGPISWQQLININQSLAQTGNSTYLESACEQRSDTQPDNFFYNFLSESGAFVFGPDSAKTPVLIPYKPLKISFHPIAVGLQGTFTVIDESGNTYYFNNRELVNNNSFGATGSWYLSQIVSNDLSDTVSFAYQIDSLGFSQFAHSFTQKYTYNPPATMGGCTVSPSLSAINETININTSSAPLYIKTITFKGGKVDFIAKSGRLDGPHLSLDSVIVSNYDYNLKKYNRLKSFKINTSYWYNDISVPSGGTSTTSQYRLKLDSLVENDQNNTPIKTHKFGYDPVPLPPVGFYSQDYWGFYNGQNSNASLLLQQQAAGVGGNVFTVGNANRNPDSNYMRAGMLEQITYPTKGYTIFTYEPHQYAAFGNGGTLPQRTAQANSVGYYHETTTTYFTTDPGSGTSGTVNINLPEITSVAITPYPYVQLVRDSDGMVLFQENASSGRSIDTVFKIKLQSNERYSLFALAKGGSPEENGLPVADISIAYNVNPTDSGLMKVVYGGGLRVRSIKDYNPDGSLLTTETYKYGSTENGVGILMTDSLAFVDTLQRTYWQYSPPGVDAGGLPVSSSICQGTYKIFSNSSTYSLSTLSGSPVMYGAVTVYKGDSVNNIGKSRYEYTTYPDSMLTTDPSYQNGIKLIPLTWKNGQVVHEAHYRNTGGGQYALEQEKYNNYYNFPRTYAMGIYIGFECEAVGFQNTAWPQPWGTYGGTPGGPRYCYFGYEISTGNALPIQSTTINYANDGVTKLTQDTVNYYYDNHAHMYPTRIFSYDGKGNTLLKQVLYPQDMVNAGEDPINIYAAMVSANIISPVIQFTESKNSTQEMQSVTNYSNTNNPSSIIEPSSVSLQVQGNPAETRLSYTKYDSQGNLLTVLKTNGVPVSYIWGYKGEYPAAEVKNAPANDIFYESFEDGNGNGVSGDAKTGNYSYLGSYSKTLTGLDNGTYVLTYWQKNGAVWGFKDTTVTVTGSYTISPNAQQVDDIRFYPASAQMTTYTYDPTVGVTSTTDAKGKIEYYEYDSMQRLMNIRDQYKNIVKSISYNYNGQATSGYIDEPSYKNVAEGGNFIKAGCGAGYTGPTVNYTVPAGTFTSNISQQDANNQAINDVSINGQNYANNFGGPCLQNITFTINNPSAATGIQLTFYGATASYTYTVPAAGGTISVPSGTYSTLYISMDNNYNPHHYTLGSRAVVYNSSASFSSVNIATGSSDLTLTIAN